MYRPILWIFLFVLFCGISTTATAAPVSFHESWSGQVLIDNSGSGPSWWSPKFNFPNAGPSSSYGVTGKFEYDNYVNYLTSFQITIKGKNDNSNAPIDLFLDNTQYHSFWLNGSIYGPSGKIGGYDVALGSPFTLALDILNNKLLYNGNPVANLTGVSKNDFIGWQELYVGIGCHFKLTGIDLDISADKPAGVTPVPESSTLILTGVSLLGLAALKLRKTK